MAVTVTDDEIRAKFAQLDPSVQATFTGQYGDSAPFFWASQNGDIQLEGPALGFYNLPPVAQATWYGVHGANAANAWAQQSGAASGSGSGSQGQGGQPNPHAPTGPVGTGRPGEDFNYGPITGKYPKSQGGTTVAPVTAATKGAGTEGTPYGWGIPGFGKAPVKINESNLAGLADPKLSPGYIPGSGTYNQYDLSNPKGGLFGKVGAPGKEETVNLRYGLGGTGDPTNGSEVQTPNRYITGNAADSGVAEQGDAKWRETGGKWKGGGGVGGGPAALVLGGVGGAGPMPMPGMPMAPPPAPGAGVAPGAGMGAAPPMPPAGGPAQPQAPPDVGALPFYQTAYATGGGAGGGGGGGAPEAGVGGGENSFFGSNRQANWGQADQAGTGLDYIATLFLRSDTPTGIGTPAWSAPPAMWQGLIEQIRNGQIYVKNPQAWQMLAEKVPGTTPQSIGGAATNSQNVQPNGQPGTGAGGTGAGGTGAGGTPTNYQYGVGTMAEGTETPFGPVQGGLPGGFGFEWNKLIQEMADAKAKNAIEEAKLTGKFNGLDTLAAKELEQKIAYESRMATVAEMAENRQLQQQVLDEAYRRAELAYKQQKDIGYIDGKATLDMQTFLAKQQQDAYTRAANPARAFENELARGATGWNNAGVDPNGAGIPGVTAPGQTLDQWAQAGAYAQYPQPQTGAQQAGGYGYGMAPPPPPPAAAQPAGANPFAGAPAGTTSGGAHTGDTGYSAAKAAAAPAMQQAAAQTGAAAQATPTDPVEYAQQNAYGAGGGQPYGVGGATYYGAQNPYTIAATPEAMAAAQQQAYEAYGQGAATAGQTGQNASGYPSLAATLVRTPGAVNAFKGGTNMSSTGNYGSASGSMETAGNAAITPDQVRLQNLKATRRMSPNARAIVGSFAAAGGSDKSTFDFYADKGAPKARASTGGYSMS